MWQIFEHPAITTFAKQSTEAQRSTKRWLENQNQLEDQWLRPLGRGDWEKALAESMQARMKRLKDWSDMANFKKLSGREFSRLPNHIAKAMDKSITTRQRLWNRWFDHLDKARRVGTEPAAKLVPTEKGRVSAIEQQIEGCR